MDRGLRAPLSPNEESTLRRIAQGGLPHQPRPADIDHLVALRLIESRDGAWRLTAIGSQRLGILPRK